MGYPDAAFKHPSGCRYPPSHIANIIADQERFLVMAKGDADRSAIGDPLNLSIDYDSKLIFCVIVFVEIHDAFGHEHGGIR